MTSSSQLTDMLEHTGISRQQLSILVRVDERTLRRYRYNDPPFLLGRVLEWYLQGKISIEDISRQSLTWDELKALYEAHARALGRRRRARKKGRMK